MFSAVSDPTRREIISLLAQADMTVNQIAGAFDLTRPAVSKQRKLAQPLEGEP